MTIAVEQDLFSFGICNPEKHVERITYEQTKPFILGIHYARRMPTVQYAFGLFDGGYLVGVVTYGQPATPSIGKGLAGIENKHNVLELNRLVILPTYEKKNAASYLVSHSLKMLPPHTFVVSYADVGGWGHIGHIYQATNFLYTGMTKRRTDIISKYGHARHYEKGDTERQVRTEKYRYVYLCGDKRERRKMRKEMKWPVISEYPKGVSRRYDPANPVMLPQNY